MVCTQKENNNFLSFFGDKIIVNCDNSNKYEYNCYMKNSTLYNKYKCDICQNDFIYNESNYYNNSFINCFEPKVVLCYNSCKTCEIEGDEINNNCIECKDEFIYKFNITNSKYKNCYLTNPFEPTTNMIKNIYTSELNPTDKDAYSEYLNKLSNCFINI